MSFAMAVEEADGVADHGGAEGWGRTVVSGRGPSCNLAEGIGYWHSESVPGATQQD